MFKCFLDFYSLYELEYNKISIYSWTFKNGIFYLQVQRKLVERGSQKGKGIAVFTSGGDSQGMNAAVRAVVR